LFGDEGVGGVASMAAGRWRRRRTGWRGERAGEGKGIEGEWCDFQVGQEGWGRTVSVSSLAPNPPQIWGQFWEKWGVRGADRGLGAALGAVFSPAMSIWTKRDRWGEFGASVGDAQTDRSLQHK
jgi:hypothetical protein